MKKKCISFRVGCTSCPGDGWLRFPMRRFCFTLH